ncbi:MAG: cytochrome c biogenesis protein CcdA, partial [Flavobacteriales bacterium]
MIRSFPALIFGLFGIGALAQQLGTPAAKDPVKWTITATSQGAGVYDIAFKATAESGWHVYSQQNFGDEGPMPTKFSFDTVPNFTLAGTSTESGETTHEGIDPIFNMKVKAFNGWALFTQRINTDTPDQPITGRFDFMTCNDEACIFPDPVYFRIVPGTNVSEMAGLPFPKAGTPVAPALLEPVKWNVAAAALDGGKWRLDFSAKVDDGWAIYSQESFGNGPIPTSIVLDSAGNATAVGKATETGPDMHEGMDDMFGVNVRKYKGLAVFSQVVEVKDPAQEVKGVIYYETCDDSKCIFPDPLKFSIVPSTGLVELGGKPLQPSTGGSNCDLKLAKVDLVNPVLRGDAETVDNQVRSSGSLWNIFFLGFIGGLLALLTPCVFPMIPLTVSFFTKGSDDKAKGLRNALTYGAFILGIYLLFSVPFHLLGSVNPEIFNEISTNPWL